MNRYLTILNLSLLVAGAMTASAQGNLENDPAYLAVDKAMDLKTIRPEVNINLPRFLIKDALSSLTAGTEDPFARSGVNLADLVKDVKLIRFMIIEAKDTNRSAIAKGVATLRSTLESTWTPVVTLPDENIGIYVIEDSRGDAMGGLALLIHDDDDTVIANIVGRVSIGSIIQLATHLDAIPKDLLKKLSEGAGSSAKMNPSDTARTKD